MTASHTPRSTTHLIYRFAGGALGVFELPLAAALLAEIAPIEQFMFDLLHRATAPRGVLGPRHISAMKIASIYGIGVKLLQWPNSGALPPAPARLLARFLALPHFAIAACSDAGYELGRLRVNMPGSRSKPRERPHS